MHERADHPDLPRLAGAQKLHAAFIVWRDAPVRSYLYHPPSIARRVDHGAAFGDGVSDRFLNIHVRAGLHGCDGNQRMPVIGCGDDGDFRLFRVEQFAEILVLFGLVTSFLDDSLHGRIQLPAIDVAHCHDLRLARPHGFAENVHSPPTGANQRRAIFLSRFWLVGDDSRRCQRHAAGKRRFQKRATLDGHDEALFFSGNAKL